MVLPGTKWPSDGKSAATLGKGRNLPEPRHGALVARRCDARGMGAHLPPCRFRLDCSGADGRGATGQQQPMRAERSRLLRRSQPDDGWQVENRDRHWNRQTAPKSGCERVKGETAVTVRPGGNMGSRACGSWSDFQPARRLRADLERVRAREFALGDKLRLRHRPNVQMVMRCLTAHKPAQPRHDQRKQGGGESVPT